MTTTVLCYLRKVRRNELLSLLFLMRRGHRHNKLAKKAFDIFIVIIMLIFNIISKWYDIDNKRVKGVQ